MKQQILIIGAGFGGMWSALSAVRLLDQHQRLDVAVTLLAPQAELRVRPRFYESDLSTTVAPLGPLFDAVGVQFVQGSATCTTPQAGESSIATQAARRPN